MHSEWTDQLSSYLDGELDPAARRRLEAHLAECADCAALANDLRRLVAAAPAYRGAPPAADQWPAIREAIDAERVIALPTRGAPSRRAFGLRHLIAAGLVMAALGAGAAWLGLRQGPAPTLAVDPTPPGPVATVARGSALGTAASDSAVVELERTLAANRDRLDSATVRIVEQNLAAIDRAIAEARAAIQRDSAYEYLNGQIAANLRKKVNLLRLATRAIASET